MAERRHTHRACRALIFYACAAMAFIWTTRASAVEEGAAAQEVRAQAVEVLQRARATYAEMQAFQTAWKSLPVFDYEDAPFTFEQPGEKGTIVFVAPNKLAVETRAMRFVADGETIRVHHRLFGQYIEVPQPDAGLLDAAQRLAQGMIDLTVIAPLLLQEHNGMCSLPNEAEITGAELAANEDGGVWSIRAEMQRSPLPMEGSVEVTLHIDEATNLLTQVEYDITEMMRVAMAAMNDEDSMMAGVKLHSAVIKYTFGDAHIDGQIAEDAFAFDPGEALKVSRFIFPGNADGEQLGLVGKTAPDFGGKDFDGNDLRIADLRGKVVVLDFWAMWCAPCLQALPHMQSLSERFSEQPVVFLGINQDDARAQERARQFLADRGVTFRQFDDSSKNVTDLYAVTSIPCTVLIDAEGIVQDIAVGFGPGGDEQLAESIERLLLGERLVDD